MTSRRLPAVAIAAAAAVITAVTGLTAAAAAPIGTGGAEVVRAHTRVLRDCVKPSCAGGKFKKYLARIKLTAPRPSRVGKLFSELTATFPGNSPFPHHHRHTWTLLTKPV